MAEYEKGQEPPREPGAPVPERRKTPRNAPAPGPGPGAYAGYGLQFVIALLVFLYLGQWVDRKLGTAPTFLIIGVFLGAGGAFYSMYRSLMAAQNREDAAKKERKDN
jgi:quinol-cytochrome oxidoreductase complex cytochrome b subunit